MQSLNTTLSQFQSHSTSDDLPAFGPFSRRAQAMNERHQASIIAAARGFMMSLVLIGSLIIATLAGGAYILDGDRISAALSASLNGEAV